MLAIQKGKALVSIFIGSAFDLLKTCRINLDLHKSCANSTERSRISCTQLSLTLTFCITIEPLSKLRKLSWHNNINRSTEPVG